MFARVVMRRLFRPEAIIITSVLTRGKVLAVRHRRRRRPELYHPAILYPTRAELVDALTQLIKAGIALDGASESRG